MTVAMPHQYCIKKYEKKKIYFLLTANAPPRETLKSFREMTKRRTRKHDRDGNSAQEINQLVKLCCWPELIINRDHRMDLWTAVKPVLQGGR